MSPEEERLVRRIIDDTAAGLAWHDATSYRARREYGEVGWGLLQETAFADGDGYHASVQRRSPRDAIELVVHVGDSWLTVHGPEVNTLWDVAWSAVKDGRRRREADDREKVLAAFAPPAPAPVVERAARRWRLRRRIR